MSTILSGARVGTLCGSGWPSDGPPKPPSPRAKREATSVASFSPFSSFSTVWWRITAPLSLPLSKTSSTVEFGRDLGRTRQRLVEGDVALAVDHHHAVEVDLTGAGAPGYHRGEGRHDLQRTRGEGALVDESEFLLVHRVGAHADAIGIEHHLAVGIGVFLAEIFQGHSVRS